MICQVCFISSNIFNDTNISVSGPLVVEMIHCGSCNSARCARKSWDFGHKWGTEQQRNCQKSRRWWPSPGIMAVIAWSANQKPHAWDHWDVEWIFAKANHSFLFQAIPCSTHASTRSTSEIKILGSPNDLVLRRLHRRSASQDLSGPDKSPGWPRNCWATRNLGFVRGENNWNKGKLALETQQGHLQRQSASKLMASFQGLRPDPRHSCLRCVERIHMLHHATMDAQWIFWFVAGCQGKFQPPPKIKQHD